MGRWENEEYIRKEKRKRPNTEDEEGKEEMNGMEIIESSKRHVKYKQQRRVDPDEVCY